MVEASAPYSTITATAALEHILLNTSFSLLHFGLHTTPFHWFNGVLYNASTFQDMEAMLREEPYLRRLAAEKVLLILDIHISSADRLRESKHEPFI